MLLGAAVVREAQQAVLLAVLQVDVAKVLLLAVVVLGLGLRRRWRGVLVEFLLFAGAVLRATGRGRELPVLAYA